MSQACNAVGAPVQAGREFWGMHAATGCEKMVNRSFGVAKVFVVADIVRIFYQSGRHSTNAGMDQSL